MPKLSIGDKAHRVLRFVMGLRTPGAINALSKYGFTEADLRNGVDRLHVVTSMRLRPSKVSERPKLVATLDAFESEWFPVARATLKHAHPEIAEWLFEHLLSARGSDIVLAVRTFIERLDALADGTSTFAETGIAARELLTARGLTTDLVDAAKATLAQLATRIADPDPLDIKDREASEAALWSWYLEWSAIARIAIKERHILRALGFRRNARPDEDNEEAEPSTDDNTPPLSLPSSST